MGYIMDIINQIILLLIAIVINLIFGTLLTYFILNFIFAYFGLKLITPLIAFVIYMFFRIVTYQNNYIALSNDNDNDNITVHQLSEQEFEKFKEVFDIKDDCLENGGNSNDENK